MKLGTEIPVHDTLVRVTKPKSKVKITENMKTIVWAITFELDVVETSGWLQMLPMRIPSSHGGWAVWGVVLSTRWWLLVDHCVLRYWDRILVRAVKGLISRAGMVSIFPLLWQRDVKLQQTKADENTYQNNPSHHGIWCTIFGRVACNQPDY